MNTITPYVLDVDSSGGKVALYSSAAGITVIFRHLGNIYVTEGNTYNINAPIGQQGNAGTSGGIHVHIAVMSGQNSSEGIAGDGILASTNPYVY